MKAEQQQIYGNILSSQIKEKNDLNSRYGTMTDNERRLNKRDLAVFVYIGINIVLQGFQQ